MISNTILPERIDTVSIYLSSFSSDDVVSFACDTWHGLPPQIQLDLWSKRWANS